MECEDPWHKVSDVYGSAGSSAGVEDEFGAFVVEVEDGVEVSVAEEYAAFQLEVEFVCVFFHAFEQLRREGLGAEFFDEAFVVDFALDFPGCDDHFVVVVFLCRGVSPFVIEERCLVIYVFSRIAEGCSACAVGFSRISPKTIFWLLDSSPRCIFNSPKKQRGQRWYMKPHEIDQFTKKPTNLTSPMHYSPNT